MARQIGIMRYTGTLAGVRHFRISGLTGHFAAMAGGPTKEQIKCKPQFQRTRENMSEFGGCAMAAKALRTIIDPFPKTIADRSLSGRLTAVMKRINLQDTVGDRGTRKIAISQQRQLLKGFQFKKKMSIDQTFKVPVQTSHTAERTTAYIILPPFDPTFLLNTPSGATHFQIINALIIISDYAYNKISEKYVPEDQTVNKLYAIEYSSHIPVNQNFPGETITTHLSTSNNLPSHTTVVQCIGIQFSQLVNGNHYPLHNKNCLTILDVF